MASITRGDLSLSVVMLSSDTGTTVIEYYVRNFWHSIEGWRARAASE